ncbi:hypothetical protein J6590_043046 [Homalodisca vitripennis]|nr:hypothetical protein J6590_043046 [Homalodisca vitripennis]
MHSFCRTYRRVGVDDTSYLRGRVRIDETQNSGRGNERNGPINRLAWQRICCRQTGRWMGEEAPKRTAAAGYITETTHPIDWVQYHQMDGNKSYGASFHTDNRIRYISQQGHECTTHSPDIYPYTNIILGSQTVPREAGEYFGRDKCESDTKECDPPKFEPLLPDIQNLYNSFKKSSYAPSLLEREEVQNSSSVIRRKLLDGHLASISLATAAGTISGAVAQDYYTGQIRRIICQWTGVRRALDPRLPMPGRSRGQWAAAHDAAGVRLGLESRATPQRRTPYVNYVPCLRVPSPLPRAPCSVSCLDVRSIHALQLHRTANKRPPHCPPPTHPSPHRSAAQIGRPIGGFSEGHKANNYDSVSLTLAVGGVLPSDGRLEYTIEQHKKANDSPTFSAGQFQLLEILNGDKVLEHKGAFEYTEFFYVFHSPITSSAQTRQHSTRSPLSGNLRNSSGRHTTMAGHSIPAPGTGGSGDKLRGPEISGVQPPRARNYFVPSHANWQNCDHRHWGNRFITVECKTVMGWNCSQLVFVPELIVQFSLCLDSLSAFSGSICQHDLEQKAFVDITNFVQYFHSLTTNSTKSYFLNFAVRPMDFSVGLPSRWDSQP